MGATRIVIACDWFLKYAVEQASALARRGVRVALVCRSHAFEFAGDFAERQRYLDMASKAGVRVLVMPRKLWDPRAVRALATIRSTVAEFRPHVLHLHDGVDPRVVWLLPRHTPTVLTVHDPTPHPGEPLPSNLVKRILLQGSKHWWRQRAAALIVHSEYLVPRISLLPHQRCVVIPHGIHAAPAPLPPPSTPVLGFFGRLAAYKGLDVIASAMPAVWNERPEVRLRVAGSGDTPIRLEDQRVSITRAYLPEAEIEAFFAETTLLLLPYTEASQTGVGSVAAGFGVPVIVSDIGGLPDLALDSTYCTRPGDASSLARAVLTHLDDDVESRRAVLSRVAAPRTWDACAGRTLSLYESLLE